MTPRVFRYFVCVAIGVVLLSGLLCRLYVRGEWIFERKVVRLQ